MDGYSISQAAERTGFPPTTLRFYEQSGLVRPARTPAGYRCYDETHIELLSFIGRAKGFGLSLDEITELALAAPGEVPNIAEQLIRIDNDGRDSHPKSEHLKSWPIRECARRARADQRSAR